MLRMVFGAAALLASTVPSPAQSPSAADVFSAASVAERSERLAALRGSRSDAESLYAQGAVAFFGALEALGQGLHRHGFDSPRSFLLPLMRLPVPENPAPEPLTYEGFRAILADFHDRMDAAAATLASIPADADLGIEVDMAKLAVDLDGDGRFAPEESAAAVVAALSDPRGRGAGADHQPPPGLSFRFDRADAIWLEGYANVLMAQADFWLAHDFEKAFGNSFHMVFPKAGLPLQDALVPAQDGMAGGIAASEWRIADFISFVHLVDWPVAEPDRRRDARRHMLEMIRLSRENWKAIRAETDNEREWLPGPHQTGTNALTGMEVGEEQVEAWHEVLAVTEDLLEGRRLMPHFRITGKGMNLKRFFDEPEAFDLVLTITGPGAVPYLEEGDILTSQEWADLRRRFGREGFLPFAIWFN